MPNSATVGNNPKSKQSDVLCKTKIMRIGRIVLLTNGFQVHWVISKTIQAYMILLFALNFTKTCTRIMYYIIKKWFFKNARGNYLNTKIESVCEYVCRLQTANKNISQCKLFGPYTWSRL